ncbi:unnamed protein product [Sphenostylis stenocarpa]|uniref:Uncharacterized protein n=1 Tax=Sphenostylis stenocarpa TaxID=92480 RepID=A0AA86VTZ8_9FABA|nr:unnamed protein product [Sphenostylis stenocarpa]
MIIAVMCEVWEQRQHTPITETLRRWGIEKQKKLTLEESARGKAVQRERERRVGEEGKRVSFSCVFLEEEGIVCVYIAHMDRDGDDDDGGGGEWCFTMMPLRR